MSSTPAIASVTERSESVTTLPTIATRVLYALDRLVSWEQAAGAQHLKELMPAFRRALNGGDLDPTRCPYDDGQLEQFEDADEHGVRVLFQCPGAYHVWPAAHGSFGELPDFAEFLAERQP